MTWNEFFVKVANGDVDAEVMAKAQTKVDKVNVEIQEKNQKKLDIFNAVTVNPQTAQDIADETGYSRQSVSSILTILCKEGTVIKTEDSPREYRLNQ